MLCLAVLALAGCGGSGGTVDTRATLALDERPSAVDAGLYLAVDRGYDADQGVELDVRTTPGRAARRVLRGRAEAAILDARALTPGLVAVMAVTQRPVGGRLYVLAVSRTTLEDRRDDVAGIISALQRGYVETQSDPDSAVSSMLDQVDGLDRVRLSAALDAIAPAFTEGAPEVGHIDAAEVHRVAPRAEVDGSLVGPVSRD